MKVKDIGEQGLLAKLQAFCPSDVIGDDAAVLVTKPGQSLVVTTDMLVDGVHFSENTTSPEDAGWRAAAANLSDLAAMGALPLGITVGLGISGEIEVSWIERLYQGITQCLGQYGTPIVGGDVVRSPTLTISISAFGQVAPSQTIRRHTATVGDVIVITGPHGCAAAGLEILLHPELGHHLKPGDRAALIKAHQRPQARLDVVPILWEIRNSYPALCVTGMDSSDGLADAVLQICKASRTGAILNDLQISLPSAFNQWLTREQAMECALYGGEDFELVLCLPKEPADELVKRLGEGAAIIGTITDGPTVILRSQAEKKPDQVLTLNRGFQHFEC